MKKRSVIWLFLIVCMVFSLIVISTANTVFAAPTIINDTVNKKVTITGTRYSMVFDYNGKAIVTSFKVDNKETLDQGTNNGIFSAVMVNSNWITTQGGVNPSVSVNGSTVSAALSTSVASETWTFTASDSNVQFQLNRSYNAAYTIQEQGTPMLNFKQDIFENIRWPASGANFWIGGKASALKKFLAAGTGYSATDNIRRGMEDINYTLISSATDNFALKVTGIKNQNSLSRGCASEVERCDTGTTKFLRFYTVVSNPTTNLSYATGAVSPRPDGWPVGTWTTGHVRSQGNRVYGDVNVSNAQNVQVTLTFTPDVYDSNYDLGTLNGVDEAKISHALNDYGRMMILDLKYGTAVENPNNAFQIPAIEQHWNTNVLGVLRDNTGVIETQKNTLMNIKNWLQTSDGHILSPYPGEQANPSWGQDYSDMQSSYVIATASLYALTGDDTWLSNMKISVEKSLDYIISTYLVRNSYTGDDQYLGPYNDYWEKSRGTYNGYTSVMLYEALVRWAELERYVLSDTTKATDYESKAAILKSNINKDKASGGFWSINTNTLYYGSSNLDMRYLPVQGAAIRGGVLSSDRVKQVVENIERDQQNYDIGFHVMNARDIRNPSIPAPQDDDVNNTMLGENGGWYGAPDGDFYSGFPVYGDRNKIPYYINRFTGYFDITGFINASTWKRDGVTPQDYGWCQTMPDQVAPIWGLYTYGYGFQPKYNMLILAPFISDNMVGSVTKYTWRGQEIQVTYDTKYKYTITALSLPTNIKVKFINQTPGISYTVKVDGVNQNITSDSEGNVDVTMSSSGTHSYELVSPDSEAILSAGINIAAGKPTAASSVNGLLTSCAQWPETTTDGNTSSGGWVSNGYSFPSWLRVDLGKAYPLGSVKMTFTLSETYKYRIEGTNDLINGTWFTLVDRTNSGVTGSPTNPITENISGSYQYIRVYFTGTVGGNWANMRELEVYTATTSTASTTNGGLVPSNALDGNDATYWCASNGVFPQWLNVDLGSNNIISDIKTKFYANELWKYKIEGSKDNTNWTVLVDKTGTGVSAQDVDDHAGGVYRYVRITVTESGGDWAAIREFKVYGDPLLSQGKTGSASTTNGGQVPSNALDGNDTTYWCASNATFPQWLSIDLGVKHNLTYIKTKFYASELWKYKIEGSPDNTNWTILIDKTAAGATAQDMDDSVSGFYRYVKITVTGSGGDWAAIREFKVYGK